jgi:hypothetical protein
MHFPRTPIIAVTIALTSQTVAAEDDLIADAALGTMFAPDLYQDDTALEEISVLDDSVIEPQPLPERYGSAGTKRFEILGGGLFDIDGSSNKAAIAGVSWNHFFADGLSWNLELNAMYWSQVGDDAWGANLNLMLRWHFLDKGSWTMFLEGGAGMVMFTDDVPRDGSNFNFTPQLGGGGTFELDGDARLVVGVRWHHISNASLYSDNPGRDSVLVYAGVSFPF